MLHWNELRYSDDGKNLIINVSVNTEEYFQDVFISKITIDNQDTYIDNGPSATPKYTQETEAVKDLQLELPLNTLGLDSCKDILFIYVETEGTPSIDTPCNMDIPKILGVVYNSKGIYNGIMCYIKEIENDCIISKNLIDSLLKYKALLLSIKTQNYGLTVKYWNKFFVSGLPNNISNSLKCNCYG